MPGFSSNDPTDTQASGQVFGPVTKAAAATAVDVATTGPTTETPYGYTTSAQAAAIVTNINALVADVASIRTALNDLLVQVAPTES